jgi:hypothetical protein
MNVHAATKAQVKQALQIQRDVDLARLFGVIKQAVSQWPDDKPLPLARRYQLALMRPDLFQASPTEAA